MTTVGRHGIHVHSRLGSITWHHTANQHHPALVGFICGPPHLANLTFLAWRLTMESEVSLSLDQLSGTAYLLNFGHLTSRWTFSKQDWRHFCLTADLAICCTVFILILCSTNVLNNFYFYFLFLPLVVKIPELKNKKSIIIIRGTIAVMSSCSAGRTLMWCWAPYDS